MKSLLKIFIIIFFICFSVEVFPQVDPTIPLQQRNLQNNLVNPIFNDNPFIEQKFPNQNDQKIFKKPGQKPINNNSNKNESEQKANNEDEVTDDEKEKEEKSADNNDKNDKNTDNDEGLFGAIRVGPMVGFGIINGPNLSIESKFWRYIGLSASYSYFNDFDLFRSKQLKSMMNSSQDFQFDTLNLSYWQYEAKLSIFPFGGSFFIGAAYGKRQFFFKSTGSINLSIPNLPQKVTTPFIDTLTIHSTYWTPQIGLLATWSGKFGWFAIGTEIGAQLTLDVSVENSINLTEPAIQPYLSYATQSPEYTSLNDQLRKTISDNLKEYPIIYWNILKIGWMF